MGKAKFANETIRLAYQVGDISRQVKDLIEVYTDRGYGTTDLLTATDINTPEPGYSPLGTPVTLAQFNEIAGLLVELMAFIDNGVVATKDRGVTINKYRTDI